MINYTPIHLKTPQKADSAYLQPNPSSKPFFNSGSPSAMTRPYTFEGYLKVPYSNDASVYRLKNGLRVVILPKEGTTIVKTYVNAGSMNELDPKRGSFHFKEHMFFNGSAPSNYARQYLKNGSDKLDSGQFFQEVSAMGAQTNASTNFAQVDYYIASQLLNPDDLGKIVALHTDMLQNPTFSKEMIEKEKGPVISEISMVLDNPDNIAINRAIKNLFQIQSTSTDLVAGTVQNIKNMDQKSIVESYNTYYTPDNMTMVITGEVDPQKTVELIAKDFTKEAKPAPAKHYEVLKPITSPKRVDMASSKATATTVTVGFAGPDNISTFDKVLLDVVTILFTGYNSSLLNKNLEKYNTQPAFIVEKIGTQKTDNTAVLIATKVNPEKTEDTLKEIYKTIQVVQNSPISPELLEMAKKKLYKNLSDISENSDYLNELVGSSLISSDPAYFANYKTLLKKVTPADVMNFARKYLDLNKASIANIHPQSVKIDNLKTSHKKSISFGLSAGQHIAILDKNEKKVDLREYVHQNILGAHKRQMVTAATPVGKTIDVKDVKQEVLPNNMGLIMNTNDTDMAFLNFDLKTKFPLLTKPGVVEILSEMLNEGSGLRNREKYFSDNDLKAIEIGFDASNGTINAQADCLAADSLTAISSLKEVILNPRLDEETFKKAKEVIRDDCKKASKDALTNSREAMYPNLVFSPKTIEKNLDSVTLDDIKYLYKYLIDNATANFAITAPFKNYTNLEYLVKQNLSIGFPTFRTFQNELLNLHSPLNENKVLIEEEQRNQAEIVQRYRFKTDDDIKNSAKYYLLNIILGGTPSSRLFMDLREKQKLAYRVSSNYSSWGNDGVFTMYILSTTDDPNDPTDSLDGKSKLYNLQKALNGFKKHTEEIKANGVTDEELKSAKLLLKQSLLGQVEGSRNANGNLMRDKSLHNNILRTKNLFDMVDDITTHDIKEAAQYAFGGHALTSLVASKNTIDANREYLNSLGSVRMI